MEKKTQRQEAHGAPLAKKRDLRRDRKTKSPKGQPSLAYISPRRDGFDYYGLRRTPTRGDGFNYYGLRNA